MKDGKLFGKINIIDLLVILVALAAVAAVGLKLTGRGGPAVTETGTDITYTVKVENVCEEVYEQINSYIRAAKDAGAPGDRLMASGELLNGYVTGVIAYPRDNGAQVTTSDGNMYIQAGQEGRMDLVFTIQAHVGNNIKTEVGTQEVRVGKTYIVKTTHFELVNGTILTCEWADGTGADK